MLLFLIVSVLFCVRLLILGLQAVAAAGQQAVALPGAGVAANAAAAAHIQQQVNVAASVSPQQPSIAAYPAGHALGGGVTAAASVAALQTAQPSLSSNAAIDAALTQAYSGIAQYTGTHQINYTVCCRCPLSPPTVSAHCLHPLHPSVAASDLHCCRSVCFTTVCCRLLFLISFASEPHVRSPPEIWFACSLRAIYLILSIG